MKTIIVTLFLFLHVALWSQIDEAQIYRFGGPDVESAAAMIQTSDGGYALLGTTGSDGLNQSQLYLVKLDSDFICEWSATYGGPGIDVGTDIVEAENGNFLFCGYSNSYTSQSYDAVVYRVNNAGQIIWSHYYGGPDWDFARSLIASDNGGYVFCGDTYGQGQGGSDGWIVRIGENGNEENNWTYGSSANDGFAELVEMDSGSLAAVGTTDDFETGESHAWVVKLAGNGLEFWSNVSIEDNTIGTGICVDGNRIFVCANTVIESQRVGLFKELGMDGSDVWTFVETYNGTYAFDDIYIANETLFLSGCTNLFGKGGKDGLVQQRSMDGGWYLSGFTYGLSGNEVALQSLLTGERTITLGVMNNDETGGINDLLVLVYPDLTYMPDYTDQWITNDVCFTTSGIEAIPSSELCPDCSVEYVDVLGHSISEWDLQNLADGMYLKIFRRANGELSSIQRVVWFGAPTK